jgi:hypothetical protein
MTETLSGIESARNSRSRIFIVSYLCIAIIKTNQLHELYVQHTLLNSFKSQGFPHRAIHATLDLLE